MPSADPPTTRSASAWAALLGPEVLEPIAQIESALRATLDGFDLPASLAEAIGYALLAPGKRIRPLLAWHSCVAVRGKGEWAIGPAVAVELIHAFSLVHDDLPAMDDDDLRRGRPTLHIARGEAMAILAGDAMLPLAFAALDAQAGPDLSQEHSCQLRASLAEELIRGSLAMISGQVFDTLGGDDKAASDHDRLRRIHTLKTGALIRASCRMGALCGLARAGHHQPDTLDAISRSAEALGMLFQVTDDLLDVEQSAEAVGKRTGKDAAAGKLTFPGVLGIEAARASCATLADEAIAALEPLGAGANALRTIVRAVQSRSL